MFSRYSRKSRLLFGLADVALTALAFYAAYNTRQHLNLPRAFFLPRSLATLFIAVSAIAWVLSGRWLGAYDRFESQTPNGILFRTGRQTLAVAVALVLFEYVARLDLSRLFLGLYLLYSAVLLLLFRWLACATYPGIRRRSHQSSLLIVGAGPSALAMARLVEENEFLGLRLVAFLAPEAGEIHLRRGYPVHPLSGLGDLLSGHVIDEVIFAVDSEQLAVMEDLLLLCDEEGVRTRFSVDFFPHFRGDVYLDRLGPAPLLTFSAAPHDEIHLLLKRITDLVLASVALIVTAPFCLLIAAAIRLTSPGPALFGQARCGLNGRTFTMYKFRSMVDDAESRKADLAHLNVKTTAFKIPNDPRVTPLGRWLRKFSLDELPQLWNVVRGDMAIVGPRPAVPSEVEQYKRWQRRRLRMRPGLTCLWTLAGRDQLDFEEWMRLDLAYIDRWSLTLDWSILLRTIPYVLTGKGAN